MSPFLKRGHTWAFFQSKGTVPLSNEIWNIMEIAGAITWPSSFKTIGLRESGPAALDTFRFERSLAMPEAEISMSGIEGYLQFTFSGSRFDRDAVPLRSLLWHNFASLSGDLIEKTD